LALTHQQRNEKISKDIVNIIGCHRPEAQIEGRWETVCLSIAKDIVTIIGWALELSTYHRSGAANSHLKPNLALEQGQCFKNVLFYFIQSI
jgi:hypothetical protein